MDRGDWTWHCGNEVSSFDPGIVIGGEVGGGLEMRWWVVDSTDYGQVVDIEGYLAGGFGYVVVRADGADDGYGTYSAVVFCAEG